MGNWKGLTDEHKENQQEGRLVTGPRRDRLEGALFAAEPVAAARPRPMLCFRVTQLSEGRGG
jgi:hypothetical protein